MLLLYRNVTDFCILILYPAILLNSFISSKVFWWHLEFSIYSIISSANSDSFLNNFLSIDVSGMLKSPIVTVLLSKFPFILFFFFPLFLLIFAVYIRCAYVGHICIYNGCVFFLDLSLYHKVMCFFVSCYSLCFKIYFVQVLLL